MQWRWFAVELRLIQLKESSALRDGERRVDLISKSRPHIVTDFSAEPSVNGRATTRQITLSVMTPTEPGARQRALRKRNFRRRAPERYFFKRIGGNPFSAVMVFQRFSPRRRKPGSKPNVSQTLVNENIQSCSSVVLIQECASSKYLRFRPAHGRGFADRQETASSRTAAISLRSGSANWVFLIVA